MSTMERVARIRAGEREYHDQCYEKNTLFEPGSWLHRPVRSVMELMPLACEKEGACVLDLGAGVGRNTIPIAQYLLPRNGAIVAVDLLESAIEGLQKYAVSYGVADAVKPVLSDIESYAIKEDGFDFIFAVSALEHLGSLEALEGKLFEIARGIKTGGVFCVIMGTNIRELVHETGESLDPMFELNLTKDQLLQLLRQTFLGWETLKEQTSYQQYAIARQDKQVILSCDCLTLAVRKQA